MFHAGGQTRRVAFSGAFGYNMEAGFDVGAVFCFILMRGFCLPQVELRGGVPGTGALF